MECKAHQPIKLLEHGMKVLERVLERRLREKVCIDGMQFGFMPGMGTVCCTADAGEVSGKKEILHLWIWRKRLIWYREK